MITNYVILGLCVIVIIAYLFDISFKYSKIPGVVLLIGLGIILQAIVKTTEFHVPNMKSILPVLGTLGLILIVMDASLEIKLERNSARKLLKGILTAVMLLFIFTIISTVIFLKILDKPLFTILLNTIPLGIISSAVAISSSSLLNHQQREFVTFESAISDIVGILVFEFVLFNEGSISIGLLSFTLKGIITVIIAIIVALVLSFLLHKIRYHVNYIIILTLIVMSYALAKLVHLPGLFLVVVFGLFLSNNKLLKNTPVKKYLDFEELKEDIESFKKILVELTFLVRSFFFIMFGFYSSLSGFLKPESLLVAVSITAVIFIMRWIWFTFFIEKEYLRVVWFAPRGLITILLFLSIPELNRINLINEDVVTLVIILSIFVMVVGNIIPVKNKRDADIVV
jgi:NhaP-type Na+/H+ or K+/H+ antiporter